MITAVITTLHILVCFVLIFVILVQGGRGQGMTGAQFGSGNVQSLFGTRAADFLTKATSVSAICFLFTCIGLNIIEARKSKSLLEASRPTAPVDVEAIKKALEKVKEGQPLDSVVQGGKLVETAEQPSADAQAEVAKVVADAQKTAAAAPVSAAAAPAQAAAPAPPAGNEQPKS